MNVLLNFRINSTFLKSYSKSGNNHKLFFLHQMMLDIYLTPLFNISRGVYSLGAGGAYALDQIWIPPKGGREDKIKISAPR